LIGKPEGKSHSEDLDVDGRILLEWILQKYRLEMCEVDSSDSGQEPVACCCEHGNEPSGSIKGGEFLE
jgi:hypothetical protein